MSAEMTSKSIIPILTAFIALLFIFTQATNPGVRLRITDKGLQYGKCLHVGLMVIVFLIIDSIQRSPPASFRHVFNI